MAWFGGFETMLGCGLAGMRSRSHLRLFLHHNDYPGKSRRATEAITLPYLATSQWPKD